MIGALFAPWIPALTLLLATALQELALPWSGWQFFRPNLVLICLFYWRLYRPDRCGSGLAFISGLAVDSLTTLPLGLSAITQILVILLVGRFGNRLRATDFLLLIPVLGVISLLEQLLQLGMMSLFQYPGACWFHMVDRSLATALAAAPLVAVLIRVHRQWMEST
ncbi:MAG: rod shape-determining protein MreD [Magnetococcales bacterium]|nr:rod shape-determining protein MreD [Magnetococcales bacterium]MBF0322506.1 rod shape-determining protein MreD [Magnetococcales bacterium]